MPRQHDSIRFLLYIYVEFARYFDCLLLITIQDSGSRQRAGIQQKILALFHYIFTTSQQWFRASHQDFCYLRNELILGLFNEHILRYISGI